MSVSLKNYTLRQVALAFFTYYGSVVSSNLYIYLRGSL